MLRIRNSSDYISPLGRIILEADDVGLSGLSFAEDAAEESAEIASPLRESDHEAAEWVTSSDSRMSHAVPIFTEVRRWLDIYFSGHDPDFALPLSIKGTPFQREVWDILLTIPYGETTTYGAIAREITRRRDLSRMSVQAVGDPSVRDPLQALKTTIMSAQAVGGALARNPIAIIIPCHRVIGAGGALTGYAGGLWRKERLLELEGINISDR